MAQDAAAHDGQVGVGAAGVMGELGHKVKNLGDGIFIHLHGLVLVIEHDAVLMEIGVGAVLQVEGFPGQIHGDDAVGLAGREVDAPGVADVLLAEHAGGVSGLGLQALHGDDLGVLFRLGQVDGDLQIAVGGGGGPLDVLGDLGGADVVGDNAQVIEPVGGRLRAFLGVELLEFLADLALPGHQRAHQAGLKVDAELGHIAVQKTFAGGQLHHLVQKPCGDGQVLLGRLLVGRLAEGQQVQQGIACHDVVQLFDELVFAPKTDEPLHIQRQRGVDLLRGHGNGVQFCHNRTTSCKFSVVFSIPRPGEKNKRFAYHNFAVLLPVFL